MANCAHGSIAPDWAIESLPECQAGSGRHKCAVCAYQLGALGVGGSAWEMCDQGHASAPVEILRDLPESQAGLQRHKCAYRAYALGLESVEKVAYKTLFDDQLTKDIEELEKRKNLPATTKEQLIQARRGQGVFRRRVLELATHCRVTGATDQRFLIASHIKPWRSSTDEERLSGFNGLAVSPHVDRLFDSGLIAFLPSGQILKSKQLPPSILEAWRIDECFDESPFESGFHSFLRFHLENVFRP